MSPVWPEVVKFAVVIFVVAFWVLLAVALLVHYLST